MAGFSRYVLRGFLEGIWRFDRVYLYRAYRDREFLAGL